MNKTKKTKPLPLIKIEQKDKTNNRYTVRYLNPTDGDKDSYSFLCHVNETTPGDMKPSFYVDRYDTPYDDMNGLKYVRFETAEQAAWFCYNLHRFGNMRQKIKATDNTILFIKDSARNLFKKIQSVRDESFNVRYEMRLLKALVEEIGLPANTIWELNETEVVAKVRNLTLQGDDVPFFSEAKLYDLLGKEDARSVLAVVEKLMEAVDPISARK